MKEEVLDLNVLKGPALSLSVLFFVLFCLHSRD